ncbi:MAG: LptF/LptG family permease [Deltaproteobacteria bacterium]|nr:LptF/LptG family permease [Deltaproteobacteria bacterium]
MITFRHLFSGFLSRVALSLLAVVALLAVGDFAELASSILGRDDALALTLTIYGHKLPGIILQGLPIATLLGLLLTLADLERSRELLALEAAGSPPWRIAAPALVLALLVSGGGILLARDLAPTGQQAVVQLETRTLGRWTWTWTLFHKPRTFFKGSGGEIYEVQSVKAEGRHLEEVARYDASDGRLTRLARADRLRHVDGAWVATGARVWKLDPARPELLEAEEGGFPIGPGPDHFQGVPGQPSELSVADLDRAIAYREAQGRPTLPLRLERHDRSARPMLTFGLSLLALGLGLGPRTPTSQVEAAGWSVVIAVGGWTLLATLRAMGLAGMLSPALTAWLPVLLPAALGAALFGFRRR